MKAENSAQGDQRPDTADVEAVLRRAELMQPSPETDAMILSMTGDEAECKASVPPPRRRRRLVLSLAVAATFLIVNVIGLWMIHQAVGHRDAPPLLTVERFTPTVVVAEAAPVTVRFNVDLVGPQEVGKPFEGNLISFSPALTGRFCWDTPRRLTFQPDAPLRKAHVYTASLDRTIGRRVSLSLDGPNEFEFRTRPLTLTDAVQVGFDDRRRVVIELTFDDKVMPDQLAKRLRLTDGDNHEIEYTLITAVTSRAMRVRTQPLRREDLFVELQPGLVGLSGPLGIEKKVRRRVATSFLLQLRRQHATTPFSGKPYVWVHFSCPIDVADAKEFIAVEPAAKFQIMHLNWDSGIKLVGDFQPGRRYRITFKRGLPSADEGDARRTLGEDVTRSVMIPNRDAGVSLEHRRGGYLSPSGNLLVPFSACNVSKIEMTVLRVYDNNLVHVVGQRGGRRIASLSKQLLRKTITIDVAKNERYEGLLDLRRLLGDEARGLLHLTIRDTEEYWHRASCLIAVTDLGIAARTSASDLLVWVNSIRKAAPVAGARVSLYSRANQKLFEGRTDADGLVQLRRADFGDQQPAVLIAESEGDVSYLQLDAGRLGLGGYAIGGRPYLRKGYEAFCFTDRGIYRPGETVHCRAIVRGVELTTPADFPVAFEVLRPDSRKLKTVMATLTNGAAEIDIPLPADGMTGRYVVRVKLPGAKKSLGSVAFRCEEFLPNRLRAKVAGGEGVLTCGSDVKFTVSAEYLFGAAAADLAVEGRMRLIAREFRHPAWRGYRFSDKTRSFAARDTVLASGTLDVDGTRELTAAIPKVTAPSSLEMVVTATVKEIGGRAVSASISRPVHPVPRYVGIRANFEGYARIDQPAKFLVAVVSPNGKPALDVEKLDAVLGRITWNTVLKHSDDGRYRYVSTEQFTPVKTVSIPLVGGKGELTFTPDACGSYRLRVVDKAGGAATCGFYVSSGDWNYTPWSMAKPERIEIATDKPKYSPGEQAKLIVKSPFAGRLLLTVETDRVLSVRTIEMDKNTVEVPLIIRDEHRPNVYISAVVIRPVEPNAAEWVAHRAYGTWRLRVDCGDRRLNVKIDSPRSVRPRTKLKATLTVTDAAGKPAVAQVTVMAVDEGALSLTSFKTPDPHGFFYGDRALAVNSTDMYSRLMPETPRRVGQDRLAGGDDGMGDSFDPGRLNPIAAKRVRVVALWAGTVLTDKAGRAAIELDVPAFQGELRLMAVAAGRDVFAAAEQPVKVRSPLMVQSSFPRFLAPGDEFVVPMTVFNRTGAAGKVAFTLAAEGPVAVVPSATRPAKPTHGNGWALEVNVPEGGQRSVFVRLRAAKKIGKAAFTIRATLGEESFERTVELPVRPPAPRTLLAGAVVATGDSRTIKIPGGWVPGTADCKLVVSGLPSLELAGGLEYLLHYPYGCVEQTTSSVMPLLYLTDLAAVIDPDRVGATEVEHYVQAGIHRLLSMQTSGGGLAGWPGYRNPYPYGTLYGGEFLLAAADRGYDVPKDCIKALLDYVESMLARSAQAGESDEQIKRATRRNLELKAYALVLLARAGRAKLAWMSRLKERIGEMSAVGRYRLADAYAASGRRDVAMKIIGDLLPASDPTRTTGGLLSSPTKASAVCLMTLLRMNAKDSRIPVLVGRIRKTRVRGRWGTTQENAYALTALGMYARVLAKSRAPFTATVHLPGEAEPRIATDAKPLTFTGDLAGKKVKLKVEGEGTAYLYWSVRGVPISGKVKEADAGIRIRRRLLARDGSPLNPKKIKQGDLVIVELTVSAADRRGIDNLVLVDLLPAGLEIENPNLDTSEATLETQSDGLNVQRTDMRDDRMILFASLNDSGQGVYRYVARAVTCGRFVLPATQIECMYDPSVASLHGRGEIVVSR